MDSGGQGAGGYGNNESYTYTLCPDAPGGAISLNFITFNLSTAGAAPIDLMAIYDGNSTVTVTGSTLTGNSRYGVYLDGDFNTTAPQVNISGSSIHSNWAWA